MRLLTALLLFALFVPDAAGQRASPFDDADLASVYVEIDPAHLDSLYRFVERDEEYPALFVYERGGARDTVEHVGFRLRGNTSRQAGKKSFKVSFNAFEGGRRWRGIEKLNLNGEHNDPTLVRSKLGWELMREMGVPASRAAHTRVYVNGAYYGLYVVVEHVDEQFLARRFGRSDGYLFKCLWPADLSYRGSSGDDYADVGGDRPAYDLKLRDDGDEAYDALARFVTFLDRSSDALFREQIEEYFDVNGFLRVLAVEVLLGHWDAYWYNQNNYYLYAHPETGRFTYIPYDLDNTFGIDWVGPDWGTRDVYDWGADASRPLVNRLLAVPQYRDRYTFYLRRLLDGAFSPDHLEPRVDELHALVADAAEADPYYPLDYGWTADDFHRSFSEALGGHVEYGLVPYVEARHAAARAQLDEVDVPPILSYGGHAPERPQTGDALAVTVRVEDEGAPDVRLLYRLDGGADVEAEMRDDGAHADGEAGDGWFGHVLDLPDSLATLYYRVSATDAGGQRSLTRMRRVDAGYTPPDVVVNEFMASNGATIADEQGDYEDWVELYNRGEEPAYVGNLTLTDDLARPDRWALPDMTIAPGGFLLIWIDDDPEEGPLHAPFKLDADGEALGLFDADGQPLDTLRFGEQATDVSLGRFPNGTGPFDVLSNPTPGVANDGPTSVGASGSAESFSPEAFPSPFSGRTTLRFTVEQAGRAAVDVYDVLGRRQLRLLDARLPAGTHTVAWDGRDAAGRDAAPGVYLLRVETPGTERVASVPVVLVR